VVRLAVRCSPEQAGYVLAELSVLSPGGVEEAAGEDFVEFAIYGAEGELPELGDIEASLGGSRVALSSTQVDEGWEERWKEFHRPVVVESPSGASSLWVGPPWSEKPDGPAVVIDPGMAFGTGAHPTTRICLSFLLGIAETGGASGGLLDLGTGSGVLAIASEHLGFDPVLAVDSEQAAVEAASANASANRSDITTTRLDLRIDRLPEAGTLVANLTGPLLVELAERIEGGNPPATIACSGFLEAERAKVGEAFGRIGFESVTSEVVEAWSGLLLERAKA
jgi:ribosomal protein L11 methyltransferase